MRYVISYDIEDDSIRSRIAKILERQGWRVQQSVFECPLDAAGLDELMGELERELREIDNGDIRVYRLCWDCHRASRGLGRLEEPPDGDAWIVV